MKEWNPTQDDLLKIERLMLSHQIEYDTLVEEKKGREVELSKLKNKYRTSHLDSHEYQDLCNQQDALKDEIQAIQPKLNEIKANIRRKQLMKDEIRNYLEGDKKVSESVEVKIRDLRNYYNKFASDATRVSSTRIMASKFTEELQEILKLIKTNNAQ